VSKRGPENEPEIRGNAATTCEGGRLIAAAVAGQTEMARLLLTKGANVNVRRAVGATALTGVAAQFNQLIYKAAKSESSLASQSVPSWNLIISWLKEMASLRTWSRECLI
jgi:hypothetical protein